MPAIDCARCGTTLPDDSGRLCPACLLALAAESDPSDAMTMTSAGSSSAGDPSAPQLIPGQIFGAYRIERLLGRGGMGEVYEAEQLEHGRRVALKVLNQRMADPEDRARFLREGQLAASVNHPNSVYIFGSEEIAGAPVITMELLAGGTLKDLVERDGPMVPSKAVDAMLHVIAGLDAANQAGVLHRDIKPSNCFVDLDGTVKVGDFGLSISTLARYGAALEESRSVQGTPQFAAPEQLKGEPLDVRADIYSVGATLYYLVTGRAPFEDGDLRSLLRRVATEQPKLPEHLRLPRALGQVLLRCLAKEPPERPASYRELYEALEPFASSAPAPAPLLRRIVAGAIDEGILAFIFAGLLLALIALSLGSRNGPLPPVFFLLATTAVSVMLASGYYGVLEGVWGMSIGKLVCGLRVTGTEQAPPGVARAAVRAAIFTFVSGLPQLTVAIATAGGPARRQQFFELMAGPALFGLGRLLLFATAGRRGDRAGMHEILTHTRVVVRAKRQARETASSVVPRMPAPRGPRFGSYRAVEPAADLTPGTVVVAMDERLDRPVWVRIEHADAAPLPAWRRTLARRTRVRWLGGRRLPGDAWDAFEAPAGGPFAGAVGASPRWQTVRFWVSDLLGELRTALFDGSAPELALDRIWIDPLGRARLLDWPPPPPTGTAPPMAAASPNAMAARRLVLDVAATVSDPLPLHARTLLSTIGTNDDALTTLGDADIAELTSGAASISRRARTRQLALIVIPLLFFSAFFSSMALLFNQLMISNRDVVKLRMLVHNIKYLDSTLLDAERTREKHLFEVYVATEMAPAVEQLVGTPQALRPDVAADVDRARLAIEAHPRPSAADIGAAREAVNAFMQPRRGVLDDVFSGEMVRQMILTGNQLLLLALAAASLLVTLLLGTGPTLRQAGFAIVARDGAPASRKRALLRTALVWSPVLLVNAITAAPLLGAPWGAPGALLQLAALGVLVAGAAYSVRHPERALQDRLAGTWLVPR